ncbi:MAG: hypothetical protein Q4C13_06945, partial [Clostridia bacterium]|nr:hypothetical protein [Clostridia bacterium]
FQIAETGEQCGEKPEHMTHLRGNLLVPKTHPRIAFRGKLDVLEGQIICLQQLAHEEGRDPLVELLEQLLSLVRRILGAEVRDAALPPFSLWGMDADAVRRASHRVKDSVGIDHPVPDWRMGKLCAGLNLLRAQVREAELSAYAAFANAGGHEDLLLAMNRLSSAVYLLFCKEVKRHG